MMRLQAGVASDRGLVRPINEDSFFLRDGLYAVCDGMGGARGGEVASQMACLGLLGLNPASAGQQDLRDAVAGANYNIVQRSSADHHLMGMGTTLTAALVHEGTLTLAHVGDSRAYLLHEGDLTQLTEDHSWVGEMVRRGDLTPAQAAIHPHRSVITRALGTDAEIEADLLDIPIAVGDRVLMCTDGLTGMVPDTDLLELLERGLGAQDTAELLVKAALAGGGEDNVTVVVVDILADDSDAPVSADTSGPFSGQVLFGPNDTARRGSLLASAVHGAAREGLGSRLRSGRRVLPALRPVLGRPTELQTVARGEAFEGESAPEEEMPEDEVGEELPAEAETPVGTAASEGVSESVPKGAPESTPETPPSSRSRRRRWLIVGVAVVLVLALAVAGFAVYNSSVYYVGTYSDGTVALYRGLPHTVLGIDLSYAIQLGPTKYDALTPAEQQQVDSHNLISKDEGQMFLQSLVPQL
jgi:serine/threonine protein phosphatase PrpC